MSYRVKNILFCVSALILGAAMYIIFRPKAVVSMFFGKICWVSDLQILLQSVSADCLRYYLSDLLWAFSLSCGLQAIFVPDQHGIVICAGTAAVCGVFWELLQLFGMVQGTGDWVDVVMYFFAAIASILINQRRQ